MSRHDHHKTVTARFLAPGGAHVTVTGTYRPVEVDDVYAVECEACGQFDQSFNLANSKSEQAQYLSQARAEQTATKHANTCRRIPERLWPEGGAQ